MRIGYDYGGTKIAGVAIDETGAELAHARVATPRHDYQGGIVAIQELTKKLETESNRRALSVGIGVPGAVDKKTGLISKGNSVWLHGQDLRKDLEDALNRPVKIANDANCFALSEAVDGAGKGYEVVFGAILGTGVGGGIVVDGKPIPGANSVCGEWGHMPLPNPTEDERPGPVCSCGVPGHIESWLSGPSLQADYARRAGIAIESGPRAPEIIELSEQKDPVAVETLHRFEDRLGRSLAMIINFLDPDVIVFGGGLSNVNRFYDTMPEHIRPHLFSDVFNTKLLPNVHGDSSGVRGAAWL